MRDRTDRQVTQPSSLLELRDVDDDGLVSHRFEDRRRLRCAGGHQQPALAQEDHERAGRLGHRRGTGRTLRHRRRVPGSRPPCRPAVAVTALFRCSALVWGAEPRQRPRSVPRAWRAGSMPSSFVRVAVANVDAVPDLQHVAAVERARRLDPREPVALRLHRTRGARQLAAPALDRWRRRHREIAVHDHGVLDERLLVQDARRADGTSIVSQPADSKAVDVRTPLQLGQGDVDSPTLDRE